MDNYPPGFDAHVLDGYEDAAIEAWLAANGDDCIGDAVDAAMDKSPLNDPLQLCEALYRLSRVPASKLADSGELATVLALAAKIREAVDEALESIAWEAIQ